MKNTNKTIPYIVAGVLFAVVFAASCVTFNFVWYDFSGSALILIIILAGIAALTGATIISTRYAKINKIKNPDKFDPPRDMFFYFKRMGFIILMTILMSLGVSFAGAFLNGLTSGFVKNMDNLFLRGLVTKLPLYIIYLYMIYKMFIRYGFMDAQRKIYNLNLKMQAFIIALIFMLPNAVYDSMFYTDIFEVFIVNVQTVLSPNVGIYVVDGYDKYINEDFSIFLVIVTVLLTFAIQLGVAWFAYKRGKKIMIKEHIRELGEYEMDEDI